MSLLTDMRDRLIAGGVTAHVERGRIPDQPDVMLALRDYAAGPSVDLDARSLPALEALALQVVARAGKSDGVAAAEALAWQAYRALSGRHIRVNGRAYDWVFANHVPAHLGFDETDRPLVVVNFSVQRHGDLSGGS